MSLGWCFWHCGCFGCLVCGTRLDVPESGGGCEFGEDSNGDLTEDKAHVSTHDENNDGGKRSKANYIGVELNEIPLCGVCAVDTIDETEESVLERGLDTVTKSDGGLSRNRLQMLSEVKEEIYTGMRLVPKRSSRLFRRLIGSSKSEQDAKSLAHCKSKCHVSSADCHS